MDADQAKGIKQGLDWQEILKEIDVKLDSEMSKLLNCNPDQLNKIQSRIGAFKEIQSLPDAVIDREEG